MSERVMLERQIEVLKSDVRFEQRKVRHLRHVVVVLLAGCGVMAWALVAHVAGWLG